MNRNFVVISILADAGLGAGDLELLNLVLFGVLAVKLLHILFGGPGCDDDFQLAFGHGFLFEMSYNTLILINNRNLKSA